jgi:hypothetical protein
MNGYLKAKETQKRNRKDPPLRKNVWVDPIIILFRTVARD